MDYRNESIKDSQAKATKEKIIRLLDDVRDEKTLKQIYIFIQKRIISEG